jgi:hypothetical protein
LIGTHDASGLGAGGVWLPDPTTVARRVKVKLLESDGHLHMKRPKTADPIVWRHPFADGVRRDLMSFANPKGVINNSELELLGGYLPPR